MIKKITKSITVVIISHRSNELVKNFIKNFPNYINILVIDNSNDFELKKKIQNFNNVKIKYTKNKGYGAAINFARKQIKTKYFFILSPDIKIISDNLIGLFQKKIKALGKFATIGPRFLNVVNKSHKQSNKNKEIEEIDFIHGSAMLFTTAIFDKIGGFDENFFLFFEETDFCKRSRKMGYKIYQINSAKIKHPKGKRAGVVKSKNIKEFKKLQNFYGWHFMWSKFYYYQKHYSFLFAMIYFLPILIRIKIKIYFYKIFYNKENLDKYTARFSGLLNSMTKKKSSLRLAI